MWGDPEKALHLETQCAELTSLLYQVTGPAHLSWQDPAWKELLHAYGIWVHVEYPVSGEGGSVLDRAGQQLIQHGPRTGNLAALSWHVTRMLRDFYQPVDRDAPESRQASPHETTTTTRRKVSFTSTTTLPPWSASPTTSKGIITTTTSTPAHNINNNNNRTLPSGTLAFSHKLALLGKARALAGSLNLLRIMCHVVIQQAAIPTATADRQAAYLQQMFTYRDRDHAHHHPAPYHEDATVESMMDHAHRHHRGPLVAADGTTTTTTTSSTEKSVNVSAGLVEALLTFLVTTATEPSLGLTADWSTVPELYDAVTMALQLLVVLLSTQLYHPMQSSFQRQNQPLQSTTTTTKTTTPASTSSAATPFMSALSITAQASSTSLFWAHLWDLCLKHSGVTTLSSDWTPRLLLSVLLKWQVQRPAAPERSIQHHNSQLAEQVVTAKGEKKGPDGMYESHLVVQARGLVQSGLAVESTATSASPTTALSTSGASASTALSHPSSGKIILDATRGVLILSTTLILLPFRLMSLALGLWGHHGREKGYDQEHKKHLQSSMASTSSSRTKDVLWLSESPLADLSTSLLLLLLNNERASGTGLDQANVFRTELHGMLDKRWEANGTVASELPDLPDPLQQLQDEAAPLMVPLSPPLFHSSSRTDALMMNFEGLFTAFGWTVHQELGALMLYTLWQACPAWAESIVVRSDLDTLVLPLLRTLYFASSSRYYAAHDFGSHRAVRRPSNESKMSTNTTTSTVTKLSIRHCPFRSQSQLYVLVILLLLFTQDASFGTDAFRRISVSVVSWYKERNIREVNLGSLIILCVLRSLTFNLNRLQDAFLLNNCCAVLMNLSPSMVDLHEYTAMRLAALTVSSMKRYLGLKQQYPNDDEEDLTTPLAMHGEVCRTLLRCVQQCLAAKYIDRNLHLIYALVYHQSEFKALFAMKDIPFHKSEVGRIQNVLVAAAKILEKAGDARTAPKALKALSEQVEDIKAAVAERRKRGEEEDYTFTYEEENDPEVFFVPYVWEVIVCAVTSSSIEWFKDRIQVFPLLDDEPFRENENSMASQDTGPTGQYSQDVSDVV